MERFVFFNTDNASVLHYVDFLRDSDVILRLAMNSYTLLQMTSFALKSIFQNSRLFCFAKDPNHPLAVTIEFAEDSTSEEEGHRFAVHMLELFLQQFGHILNSRLNKKSFKAFNKSLRLLVDQLLDPIMEKIADSSGARFLYVSFSKKMQSAESLAVNTKGSFMSPSSSVNTDILNVPKTSSSEIKKKYPFVFDGVKSNSQLQVYRIYSKEAAVSHQVVAAINSSAVLANEMMEFEKDELQVIEFCMKTEVVKALKFNEMILVVSVTDMPPDMKQVKQLYYWARFLVA
jgi:hypothetical protein